MKVYDVYHTMWFNDGTEFGISIGTLVLATESILLFMYVASCHAFRHLFGGGMNQWRGGISGIMGKLYIKISNLNIEHAFWFWTSLVMVFLGDLFVLAVAEGILTDIRIMWGEIMSEKYIVHEHDVVIIGAGGAGLRAAIEASNSGVSVAMICKSMLGINNDWSTDWSLLRFSLASRPATHF